MYKLLKMMEMLAVLNCGISN